MTDSSKFFRAIKNLSAQPESAKVDMVTGVVTSIKPLKVKADEVELTETFLIVGALCQQSSLWRGLQVDDKVLMIRMANSQQYYIMQRKEGIQ